MTRKLTMFLLVAAVTLALSIPAKADSITYDLNVNNGALPGSGPWGTVGLVLNGNGTITITVTGASGFEVGHMFGFNVNGAFAGISVTGAPTGWSLTSNTNVDGFGKFEKVESDGGSDRFASFSFTVDTTTSGKFTTVNNLVELNSNGYYFATHVFPIGSPDTGFAASTTPTNVIPEPGTLALFGTGLLGMAGAIRRRIAR